MTRQFTIGIDLGWSGQAAGRAAAATAAGASLARVRFTLGAHPFPDATFLDEAMAQVAALRAAGLAVMAVVDGHLTVAPAGLATADDAASSLLAAAWAEELVANASTLATAIGPHVTWWEVLPEPNASAPSRLTPERWADLVARLARVLRIAAPQASIVSGGLLSDESDDGVEYWRAAWQAGEISGAWATAGLPMDTVGVRLAILPDGGASEEAVGATVRDRVQRLWRALAASTGEGGLRPAIMVTGVGWAAERAGESAQARNLWVTLDTLSTEEVACGVVWDGLQDEPDRSTGLYRATGLETEDRRPAWQAYSDFVQYLRQIAPSASWLAGADLPVEPGPAEPGVASAATETAALLALLAPDERLPEPDVFPPTPEPPPAAGAAIAASALADATETDSGTDAPPETAEPALDAPPETAEPALDAPPETAEPTLDAPPETAEPALDAPPETAEPALDAPPDTVEPAGSPEPTAETVEPTIVPPLADEAATTDLATPLAMAAVAYMATEADAQAESETTIESAPSDLAEPSAVVFHMPTVAEVLRAEGWDGARLALALAAIAARHGDAERLPPGDYHVPLAPPDDAPTEPAAAPEAPSASPPRTNQQVISALYRAGGGSWALFERSGLVLAELAGRRNAPYTGPDIADLGELSAEETAAVRQALDELMAGA